MATPPKSIIKRYRRTHAWDYAKGASLFITISTSPRRAVFGRVEGEQVRLSQLGQIVADAIRVIGVLNSGVTVFGWVVMPDHIHLNVHLAAGLKEPLKVLGKAIGRFKVYTTKQAKLSLAITSSVDGSAKPSLLWQQGYHDRLCLTREFIDSTERYIAYNPLKWSLMYGEPNSLKIHEPLDSPWLDANDYWKGVGNIALLGENEKIVSVRISRDVKSPALLAEIRRRIADAVSQGYVILSGFVSPAEKAVRDDLCANSNARFIRILPSSLPNRRYKPESRYLAAFKENRYLEIARGNEEVEFCRRACLDYNAEIVEIAKHSSGLALYWKAEGLKRL